MTDKTNDRLAFRVEQALEHEAVYRGTYGKKSLRELLPTGIGVKDILPRILHLVAGPYRVQVDKMAETAKASAAERRVLARKVNQVPDVVIHDDLSLVEVGAIMALYVEGAKPTRIAALFEVPTATVRQIIEAMSGKHTDRVILSAEMRRRRKETLTRPETVRQASPRAVDMHGEDSTHGAEPMTEVVRLHR